jgi:hydroxypyruvate isomerase
MAATATRLRLSVAARNFGTLPIPEMLRTAAEIGFETCDNFNWREPAEFRCYADTLRTLDLQAGVLVVNKRPDVNALGCSLVSPADRERFLQELRLCIEAAKAVDCSRLEVLTGNTLPRIDRELQMQCCVETLRCAIPLLEANGMTVLVEGLNTTVDHPGYFLDRVQDGVEMVRRVNSPHVKFLFDIYHVQIMEGNLIARMRENIDFIGQFHFADVPGRHEPGTGEINFRNVFRAIYALGERYKGYVTAEYEPTVTGLRDLAHVRDLATFDDERGD